MPANDYVDCGAGSNLAISGSITTSAWIKTTISSGTYIILEKSPSGSTGYNMLVSSGKLEGRIYSSVSSIVSTAIVSDGRWHNVVMSNENIINGWSLYVDGVSVKSQNGTSAIANSNILYIGARSTTLNFNGHIDEVRIYNTAISTSQIKEQYYVGLNNMLNNGSIDKEEYQKRIYSFAINY